MPFLLLKIIIIKGKAEKKILFSKTTSVLTIFFFNIKNAKNGVSNKVQKIKSIHDRYEVR